jgi:hypothetical protein
MNEFAKIIGLAVMGAAALSLAAFLSAWPVQALWNWLMPELFGFKSISFFQALGLSVLCSFLFKSSNTSSSSK